MGSQQNMGDLNRHVFVRFTHPERGPSNVETTSGGRFARDEWYRENMPMTDRAIEAGAYMRALSKAEGESSVGAVRES